MGITENAAYLKGLFDGYELDKSSKEGKIIGEMLTLIGDMADKLQALEAEVTELREYIEEIDEDLGAVEDDLYLSDEDEEYEDEDDSDYYELECPSCGETVCFDDSLDLESIVCPACGEKIDDIEICDGACESCEEECDARN